MFRQLDDKTMVSGQIQPADLEEAKRLGVTMVVNNRPDGEDPDQPPSVAFEQAAESIGLDYRHVPIARGMGPADIEEMCNAMQATGDGKLLAFCRSGNRSALVWALASREQGVSREEVERSAEGAGFSLAPVSHLL